MYLSKNDHYISNSLILTAVIHLSMLFIEAALRTFMTRTNSALPDMTEELIRYTQLVLSTAQLLLISFVFYVSYRKLHHKLSLIEDDDQLEMAVLQHELFHDDLAVLTGDSIRRLLQLWAFILIAVQLIYDISSFLYQIFIRQLSSLVLQSGSYAEFVVLYNFTHGFKYVGMLVAIIIGVMTTGIFLKDRKVMLVSVTIAALYLLSFAFIEIQSISLFGRTFGIVWSSVIFHLMETLGIASLGIYLRLRYKGL